MHRKADIVKYFLNEVATSATILMSLKRYTGRIRTCQVSPYTPNPTPYSLNPSTLHPPP